MISYNNSAELFRYQKDSLGYYLDIIGKAGTIFVEVEIDSTQSSLYGRQVNFDGNYEWVCLTGEAPVSAADVADRLHKESSRDPDCWIICVQDPKGRNIFTIEPDLD